MHASFLNEMFKCSCFKFIEIRFLIYFNYSPCFPFPPMVHASIILRYVYRYDNIIYLYIYWCSIIVNLRENR